MKAPHYKNEQKVSVIMTQAWCITLWCEEEKQGKSAHVKTVWVIVAAVVIAELKAKHLICKVSVKTNAKINKILYFMKLFK